MKRYDMDYGVIEDLGFTGAEINFENA